MIKLGPEEIVKYPFVEDAISFIQQYGFTPKMLGTSPDMRAYIDTAMNRIRAATCARYNTKLRKTPRLHCQMKLEEFFNVQIRTA